MRQEPLIMLPPIPEMVGRVLNIGVKQTPICVTITVECEGRAAGRAICWHELEENEDEVLSNALQECIKEVA